MQQVEGLFYVKEFIPKQTELQLIQYINKGKWNTSLRRKTQHYGYQYSYDKVNTLQKEQPIPQTFQDIQKQIQAYLFEMKETKYEFDQLIINEYQPGQGISPHTDNKQLFGDIIVGLSLGSNAEMVFERKQTHKQCLMLQRRSLLIMSGVSRYEWKHSIPARKKDNGVLRGTRLSMTWRIVRPDYKK